MHGGGGTSQETTQPEPAAGAPAGVPFRTGSGGAAWTGRSNKTTRRLIFLLLLAAVVLIIVVTAGSV
jgi:hypothetical protein